MLTKEVVEDEGSEGVGRIKVKSEDRERRGEECADPQEPEPGVNPPPSDHQVWDVTSSKDSHTAAHYGCQDEPVANLFALVVVLEVGDVVVGPGVASWK